MGGGCRERPMLCHASSSRGEAARVKSEGTRRHGVLKACLAEEQDASPSQKNTQSHGRRTHHTARLLLLQESTTTVITMRAGCLVGHLAWQKKASSLAFIPLSPERAPRTGPVGLVAESLQTQGRHSRVGHSQRACGHLLSFSDGHSSIPA